MVRRDPRIPQGAREGLAIARGEVDDSSCEAPISADVEVATPTRVRQAE